jgi:hypothetical protein
VWYKTATSFDKIDEIAKIVSEMNPYDPLKHWGLLVQKPDKPPFQENIDDKLKPLYDMTSTSRNYLSIHPQIYIYPKKSHNRWRYLLYDPKDFQRMNDPGYYQDLATPIDLTANVEEVYDWLHSVYPTSLIDDYTSEEEMLKG